ncbi:mRNA-capping enzyme subunit beta [Nakaseomyces glabratus]|nr:mRNA capping enzyme, beta chain [Nakaseomyces glabratus]QNG13297.1 uncharacterized protein GWK60_E05687 [Nakaseomyces glabratus]SCV15523.1 mRNA-capping enzyme subunit beta [Nakaseomyces glabratus]SLM14807.1 mRNA-capping enzyme subunit beta [Nakaseomyces glabratus]
MSEHHSKRALSLDDLVNHDENDKSKLQKLADNESSVRSDDNRPGAIENIVNGNNSNSDPNSNGVIEEDTDTDDDVGGEFTFDNGITFDYDKQDRFSPEKKRIQARKKDTSKTTPSISNESPSNSKESSVPVDPLSSNISATDRKDSSEEKPDLTGPELVKEPDTNEYKRPSIQSITNAEDTTYNDHKAAGMEKTSNKHSLPNILSDSIDETVTEEHKPKTETEQTITEYQQENKQKDNVNESNSEETHDIKNDNMNQVEKIFQEKTSTLSKKNSVKKDLELLNEISASSKPNKYKNTPIWAQKWKPTVKALQNIDTNDFKIDNSILDIIPDDDLTKSVQDWVYATLYSIDPDLRPFIELEMKFGVLLESKSPDRVNPPVSSQAVYTDMDAHLTPNVDETVFKELSKYIQSLSEITENAGKFNVIEAQTKDAVYRVGTSTQRPRFLRMSSDVKTGRIGAFIEKRHISQLLIYSPKDSYDVKLSINLELPVPENDPPEKYQHQTPVSERTKERVSYIHNDSCTRFDITKVQNHNKGIKSNDVEITHEIELEINTPALIKAFDNIMTDSKEYATLIRTFLNNGTIVRRKLSSLSYEIFEGQKKIQ